MNAGDRLRILLVDDHDVVRAGTRALLSTDFDIVGEADNVDSAIELIKERLPELVVLDVKLPGGGGAAVIDSVRRDFPDVMFMALTVSTSREDVMRLLNAGVNGYVTKTTQGAELPDLVRQTAAGARPVSADVAAYLLDIDEDITSETSIDRLTPREREEYQLRDSDPLGWLSLKEYVGGLVNTLCFDIEPQQWHQPLTFDAIDGFVRQIASHSENQR